MGGGLRRDKPQKGTTRVSPGELLALGPGGSRARGRWAVIEQGIHLGSLQPQTRWLFPCRVRRPWPGWQLGRRHSGWRAAGDTCRSRRRQGSRARQVCIW